MQENQGHILDLVFNTEAGYWDDPRGGPTNLGITLTTLSAWRKEVCSVADLQKLTRDEAEEIYEGQYLRPIMCDRLPGGLDYALADFSINSGPGRAVRELQEVVSCSLVDGVMGEITLTNIAACNVVDVINGLCDRRMVFMKSLSNWSENETGWTKRVARVRADALTMAHGAIVAPRAMLDAPGQKAIGAVKLTSTPSGQTALATFVSVLVSVGAAAGTATGMLQPYGDIKWVRFIIVGLTLAASASSLVVAAQRAADGSTK